MNKLKQSTQLKQKKILSHQTRQAISILQLNSLDLHKEIENIILENPFLEKEIDMEPSYNLEHTITSNNTNIDDILNYFLMTFVFSLKKAQQLTLNNQFVNHH